MDVPWQVWVFSPYLLLCWLSRRAGALNFRWFAYAVTGAAFGGSMAWGMWRVSYAQEPGAYPTAWVFPMMMHITQGAWFGGIAGATLALARSGRRRMAAWFCLALGLVGLFLFLFLLDTPLGRRSLVASLRDLRSGLHWLLFLCVWGACLLRANTRGR